MSNEKFDAMSIDTEMQSRIRLKQATNSVPTFGKFYQSGSLDEALKKLSGPERCDVVFVSDRMGTEGLPAFIKSAKQAPAGQDAAYVMIVKAGDEMASMIAQSVLLGVDGFLCEPYSVDSLTEITRLASKVRKERSEAREEAAVRFLMGQISEQISIVAQLKSMKMNAARETRKLQEMCQIFTTLDEEAKQRYQRIAVDVFENAPLPKPLIKKNYGGASSRVKARLEKKVLDSLSTEAPQKTSSSDVQG